MDFNELLVDIILNEADDRDKDIDWLYGEYVLREYDKSKEKFYEELVEHMDVHAINNLTESETNAVVGGTGKFIKRSTGSALAGALIAGSLIPMPAVQANQLEEVNSFRSSNKVKEESKHETAGKAKTFMNTVFNDADVKNFLIPILVGIGLPTLGAGTIFLIGVIVKRISKATTPDEVINSTAESIRAVLETTKSNDDKKTTILITLKHCLTGLIKFAPLEERNDLTKMCEDRFGTHDNLNNFTNWEAVGTAWTETFRAISEKIGGGPGDAVSDLFNNTDMNFETIFGTANYRRTEKDLRDTVTAMEWDGSHVANPTSAHTGNYRYTDVLPPQETIPGAGSQNERKRPFSAKDGHTREGTEHKGGHTTKTVTELTSRKTVTSGGQKEGSPVFDGITNRWVRLLNGRELYDDTKPFLGQIIYDLKFDRHLSDLRIDAVDILRTLVTFSDKNKLKEIARKDLPAELRKRTQLESTEIPTLDEYVRLLNENEYVVLAATSETTWVARYGKPPAKNLSYLMFNSAPAVTAVLKHKYVGNDKSAQQKITDYVERFCDTTFGVPFGDKRDHKKHAVEIKKLLDKGNREYDEFDKQLILVSLLEQHVKEARADDKHFAPLINAAMGWGKLPAMAALYGEYVFGTRTTDDTLRKLVEILETETKGEKPECIGFYKAMQGYTKACLGDELTGLQVASCYRGTEDLAALLGGKYENFQDQVNPAYVQWDFAREKAKDKHSKGSDGIAGSAPTFRTIVGNYYGEIVRKHLSTLETNKRRDISQYLNPAYIKTNWTLADMQGVAARYATALGQLPDDTTENAFCYKFIDTMRDIFFTTESSYLYSEKSKNLPYAIGPFGLDTAQSASILDTAVQKAMTSLMNKGTSAGTVYKQFDEEFDKRMKLFACPFMITTSDRRFVDFTAALNQDHENMPEWKKEKCDELKRILQKVYYRKNASDIAEKLGETRKDVVDLILKQGYSDAPLMHIVNSIPTCVNIATEQGKTRVNIKEFDSAYEYANPETKDEIRSVLFGQLFGRVDLAVSITNNPDTSYGQILQEQRLPATYAPLLKHLDENSIFSLIGKVIYDGAGLIIYEKNLINVSPEQRISLFEENLSSMGELVNYFKAVVNKLNTDGNREALEKLGRSYIAVKYDDRIDVKRAELVEEKKLPQKLAKLRNALCNAGRQKLEEISRTLGISLTWCRTDVECANYVLVKMLKSSPRKQLEIYEGVVKKNEAPGNLLNTVVTSIPSDQKKYVLQEIAGKLGLDLHLALLGNDKMMPIINNDVRSDPEFCASVIKLALNNVVGGNEEDQDAIVEKLKEQYGEIHLPSNEKERLQLLQSVTPLEIEYINSLVFSVINGDEDNEELLMFAENDYSDWITSDYLGHSMSDVQTNAGRKYLKASRYTDGIYVDYDGFGPDDTKEGKPIILTALYMDTPEGEKLREAVGLPKIDAKKFQNLVGLMLTHEYKGSAVPTEKFYAVGASRTLVSPDEIADKLGLGTQDEYIKNQGEVNSLLKQVLDKFVDDWCRDETGKEWTNGKKTTLREYLFGKYELLKRDWQTTSREMVVQSSLMRSIAIFNMLAERLGIRNINDLRGASHPQSLTMLLSKMRVAFDATDNVCPQEAENMCTTWLALIEEEYRRVLGEDDTTEKAEDVVKSGIGGDSAGKDDPAQKEINVLISRICGDSAKAAMTKLMMCDPALTHPVWGVETGQQLRNIYSGALNMPLEHVELNFDINSRGASGTADFISPTAPNRVRAYNASKSLNLGSIISIADEINNNPTQKEYSAIDKLIEATKKKSRTFEDTVRVFDDKSLLLKTNELISEGARKKGLVKETAGKTYSYFGDPSAFSDSWTLRSRLTGFLNDLKKYGKELTPKEVVARAKEMGAEALSLNSKTAALYMDILRDAETLEMALRKISDNPESYAPADTSYIDKLDDWINGGSSLTLNELNDILVIGCDVVDDKETSLLDKHRLATFETFSTQILPLYLVDQKYIECPDK